MAKKTKEEKMTLKEQIELNSPMTRTEIAKALKVCPDTISDWIKRGLPCFYIGRVREARRGSRPRFRYEECIKWLGAQ